MEHHPRTSGTCEDEPIAVADGPGDWRATRAPQTRAGHWWELQPRLLRAVAVVALAWGCAYLAWRLLETGRAANPEAFYVLWFVELYNFTSLVFLAFYGWRWSPPRRPAATPGYLVDVFVATYDEPREVVEPTLARCAALRYPHETYLLDDGRRSEMEAPAAEWGAHWISRPDNSHAKAGNINHALGVTSGELIFCLDADHVPFQTPSTRPSATSTMRRSPSSRARTTSTTRTRCNTTRSAATSRACSSRWSARARTVTTALTGAARRRSCVGELLSRSGGVATETIAEDFHTTIKMHEAGWRTHYHDEILVQGLAPLDLDGYL